MTDHRNDERTVRCPVEGCDAEKLARGVHLHVRQSAGEGHGPQGEIPDNVSLDDLETVGKQEVEMDYPAERDSEEVVRLCPYCSQPFKGKNGVLIHLGQVAGRKNHPEDAAQRHTQEDFPEVEVDEAGNITSVANVPEDPERSDTDKGVVSKQLVYNLIAELLADREMQMANRVRERLLGIDSTDRPIRAMHPYPGLLDALFDHYYEGHSTEVRAVIKYEGIMIACRDESTLYSVDEALDEAAGFEKNVLEDKPSKELRDFIEFLRYGADLLIDDKIDQGYQEEFADWRDQN